MVSIIEQVSPERVALQKFRSGRSRRFEQRIRLAVLLSLSATNAMAYPVSYSFSGQVTEFHYSGTSFHPDAGSPFVGSITYDANYDGTFLSSPWPTSAAILNWQLSVGGEQYSQELLNPLVQTISLSGNRISFFDEMPGNTPQAPFFDQGGISFTFADSFSTVPAELPLDSFVNGEFVFGGGSTSTNAGALLRGSIGSIHLIPEPSSGILLTISLAVFAVGRKWRTSRNGHAD